MENKSNFENCGLNTSGDIVLKIFISKPTSLMSMQWRRKRRQIGLHSIGYYSGKVVSTYYLLMIVSRFNNAVFHEVFSSQL